MTAEPTGEPFDRLVGLLRALHERHRDARGLVTLRYVTEVWRAERIMSREPRP